MKMNKDKTVMIGQISLKEWERSFNHKTFVGCEKCYEEFERRQKWEKT